MNKLKNKIDPIDKNTNEISLNLSQEKSIIENNLEELEKDIEQQIKLEEKKAEELKDSEELMNKIVKTFLNNTDVMSKKFNQDLETINSLDLKLLKIQNKLRDVLSENAFYSKEIRRLKVTFYIFNIIIYV